MLDSVLGSSPETWDGEDCSAREVVLALEPHVGDGLCERPEVDSPYLRLNFDISHFEVSGVSTARSVELLAPLAAHTHVKDQRGRVPDFEFLIPGEGPFDFCDYLRRMDDGGGRSRRQGHVAAGVEPRPSAFAAGGTPRPGGAERSLGWAYLAAAGRLKTGASGVESGALKR